MEQNGKRAWKQLGVEAIAVRSADHVRQLLLCARTRDTGAAIARLAVDKGIVMPNNCQPRQWR
jgi:hypothetical protein